VGQTLEFKGWHHELILTHPKNNIIFLIYQYGTISNWPCQGEQHCNRFNFRTEFTNVLHPVTVS